MQIDQGSGSRVRISYRAVLPYRRVQFASRYEPIVEANKRTLQANTNDVPGPSADAKDVEKGPTVARVAHSLCASGLNEL